MSNTAILSVAYLPPIQYFTKLVQYQHILVESLENYTKQTYRNRCVILGANGPLALTIPVIKTQGNHTPIKLVEIDNSTLWQKNHWKAIESAYRTSAYYDFVADILNPFYSKRFTNLFEFDSMLMSSIFDFLSLAPNIHNVSSYNDDYGQEVDDYRGTITPKVDSQSDLQFHPVVYFQVFSNKFGFVPNLSIIDLLFNEGLSAIDIIEASTK
ncbi:MAG: WbqC family protein [Bacteroidales bacterium]